MSLLALDSRWRRFNDPDRACPCCGRRFFGIYDIGFDAPDDWPHGPRDGAEDLEIGGDRLGPELCRIGTRYFLRAVLTIPLRGSDEQISFGPWAEVPEPVFRACLATIEDPIAAFPPAEGILANTLPLFEEDADAAVTLTLPDPAQRPVLAAEDGALADAQAEGISFDDLLDIYAACGDDIRPHLAADCGNAPRLTCPEIPGTWPAMTKLALITGASRGLGFALAEALAPEYHIIAVARTVGGLEELDDRIQARGGQATLAPMDITDRDAMAHLCRSIYDRWSPEAPEGEALVSLWAHTAVHASALTPAPHIDPKEWQKSLSTNVDAMGHLIPFVAPLLGETGQALFFDDPIQGQAFYGLYGTTKAAQIALARSWGAETERTGPRIHILQPAPMATAVRARFHPGENREALATPEDEAQRLLSVLACLPGKAGRLGAPPLAQAPPID